MSDGLIAALLFFVLQATGRAWRKWVRGQVLTANMVWVAFCSAGAVTYGLVRLIYWRARTADVPRRARQRRAARAVVGGARRASRHLPPAFAYIEIVRALGLFPVWRSRRVQPIRRTPLWLAVVAIIAAPDLRGVHFPRPRLSAGCARSFAPGVAALASAAIFAIVHPPVSVIPVFIMGVGAALVYRSHPDARRARSLLHAVYNAAVLGLQWKLMA